ncbi:MAG: polysaccharide biosynthesis protein [Clostridia bacterium]|nr:polysaccharide biosynthesis protein [Clostridia bacterium]
MRTLVLSCNTGEGHNSAAKAIKEYYELQGEYCVIEDSISFTSQKMSKFLSDWHVFLYRHMPTAFGKGYGFIERHPSYLEEGSAAYKLLTIGTKKLQEYISENSIDNVICTHIFSALLLTRAMEKYPMCIKTAMVYTDYTCFPGTSATYLDVYFLPHSSLAPIFANIGIPEKKLVPAGIPVRQKFFNPLPKDEAKRLAGVDPDHTHILMMSGSMGCGPIEATAVHLAEKMGSDCELTIICGTNKSAKEDLEKALGGRKNIHILGFVENVPALLDSADIYFTKPGGISTSEAAKKAIPMVLIQAVEGCETHNYKFFTKMGVAVLSDKPEKLAEMGLEIINTDGKLEEMAEEYKGELQCNGAQIIFETMRELK